MSLKQLIRNVEQAEAALVAHERDAALSWRQVKSSWHATWTPWSIVLAGVASGFLAGRAHPIRAVMRGNQLMQLVTLASGLFASSRAHEASGEAGLAAESSPEAAESSREVEEAVTPAAARTAPASRHDGASADGRAHQRG